MKKTVIILLSVVCALTIVSCGNSSKESAKVKNGIYTVTDEVTSPYILFNTEESSWRSGMGLAVSYGIGGKYQIDGKIIVAKSNDGSVEIVFEAKNETEFKLTNVKCDANKYIDWLNKGDVYSLKEHVDTVSLFDTICSADEALALSRGSETVVFEGMKCTSGNDLWNDFYQTVSDGKPVSVLCVHYYVLNKEHMSRELYEAEKDRYPKLFYYLVEYDGDKFTVTTRESTENKIDYKETFKYLMYYTGKAPAQASFSSYDYYVLVDDPTATWEGIEAGMVSSQYGAGYKHCSVYKNIFD